MSKCIRKFPEHLLIYRKKLIVDLCLQIYSVSSLTYIHESMIKIQNMQIAFAHVKRKTCIFKCIFKICHICYMS